MNGLRMLLASRGSGGTPVMSLIAYEMLGLLHWRAMAEDQQGHEVH